MEVILSVLYLGNAFVTVLAYIPQIIKLKRVKGKPENFSLLSWLIWFYTASVSLIYATFVVKDLLLVLVGTMSLSCIITVILIILYKNHKYV